jgi:hypothetical protein
VVYSHDECERFLDQDAVAIDIGPIKETPSHGDTTVHKQITEELGGERCGVRFHLAKEETASTTTVSVSWPSLLAPAAVVLRSSLLHVLRHHAILTCLPSNDTHEHLSGDTRASAW